MPGASGIGKEQAAHAVDYDSPGANGPFIPNVFPITVPPSLAPVRYPRR